MALEVYPPGAIPPGTKLAYTLQGQGAAGATWSSSAPGIVSIEAGPAPVAIATAHADGVATLTAVAGGEVVSWQVKVATPPPGFGLTLSVAPVPP